MVAMVFKWKDAVEQVLSTNTNWVSRNLELIYNIFNLRDTSCYKVASLVIDSGRKLTIGVKYVVDVKNGTEEAVDYLNKFFGVY